MRTEQKNPPSPPTTLCNLMFLLFTYCLWPRTHVFAHFWKQTWHNFMQLYLSIRNCLSVCLSKMKRIRQRRVSRIPGRLYRWSSFKYKNLKWKENMGFLVCNMRKHPTQGFPIRQCATCNAETCGDAIQWIVAEIVFFEKCNFSL